MAAPQFSRSASGRFGNDAIVASRSANNQPSHFRQVRSVRSCSRLPHAFVHCTCAPQAFIVRQASHRAIIEQAQTMNYRYTSALCKALPMAVASMFMLTFATSDTSEAQQRGASSESRGQTLNQARRSRLRPSNRRRIRRNRARRQIEPQQDWRSQALSGGS